MCNIKSLEEFAEVVKDRVQKLLGDNIAVSVVHVTKNNGLLLTGIRICVKGCNIAPTLYLEDAFEVYKGGKSMDAICEVLIDTYKKHAVCDGLDVSIFKDFNRAKERICYKLVNAERNAELLATAPHVFVEDLAVVFYVLVSEEMEGLASAIIHYPLMEAWGVDTDRLYELARENTPRLLPAQIRSMWDVMFEMYCSMPYMDWDMCRDMCGPLYVATNCYMANGAGVILYDDCLAQFSKDCGKSFYILPSSVHEALILLDDGMHDADFLREMVQSVNATRVAVEDFLSDNIYRYDADTNCVKMVSSF